MLPLVHTVTAMPLDLVLAGPGLDDLFLSRAVVTEVDGIRVPVASPEDLVVMKILAGRPKDIEDVRLLLAERLSKLDLKQIRELLEVLEEAIHQSDLVPIWDRELAAVRRRVR